MNVNSDIWNHQKFGTGLYKNRGILRNNQVTCYQVRSVCIGEGLVPTDAAVNFVVGRLGAIYEREADKQESSQRNLHAGLSMLFTSQAIRESCLNKPMNNEIIIIIMTKTTIKVKVMIMD